jgi:hypothetical protein
MDDMYFVINQNALALDEFGSAIIAPVLDNGTVDWDSADLIDWLDLKPDTYQLYKATVDFLQEYQSAMYIK